MSAAQPHPYLPGKSASIAKAVTVLFNPQWMQLFWLVGVIDYYNACWEAGVYVLVAVGIIPSVGYWVYSRQLKLKNTYDLPHRYRLVPFVFNFLGLALLLPLLLYWPQWVQAAELDGVNYIELAVLYCFFTTVTAAVVTVWYKLSLHMVGYLAAALPWMYVNTALNLNGSSIAMAVFMLFSGGLVMAWSRLTLRAHTPAEIRWGTVAGLVLPPVYWGLVWLVG